MPYAAYDPATGTILRISSYPDCARPGEAVVPVAPDVGDATHKIEDGQAVLKA